MAADGHETHETLKGPRQGRSVTDATLHAWGKRARERVFARVGHSRPSGADWWPEVHRATESGYNVRQIARALRMSDRRVRAIRAEGTAADAERLDEGPSPELPDEVRALVDWTVDSFAAFYERFSGYEFLPHFRPWVESFLREPNLILNVPPGHAKSTVFSIWIPIWLVCRDRNAQIVLVSKTNHLAAQWANAIADQLEGNEDLVKTFSRFAPEIKGETRWSPANGKLIVVGRDEGRKTKGVQYTILARGSGQQVYGIRADFVIIDDPTDQAVARSEDARRDELVWIREQVLSRMQPGGHAVVVGQRVHTRDLYGALADQLQERGERAGEPLFHVEKYPAVLDWEKHEVLWPAQWSFEELMRQYERVGGRNAFETLYQQNPVPEGGGLVTPEMIDACRTDRPAWQGVRTADNKRSVSRVLSIDPSPTKYHGVVLGDLAYSRDQFQFDVMASYRVKAGGLRILTDEIAKIIMFHRPDYLVFEESTFARWIYDDPVWQAMTNQVQIVKHHTTSVSKGHAKYGLQSLDGDFEFCRVSLPCGDDAGRRMTHELAGELLSYEPDNRSNLTDIMMALWFVKFNWLRCRPLADFVGRFEGLPETPSRVWQKFHDAEEFRSRRKGLLVDRAREPDIEEDLDAAEGY